MSPAPNLLANNLSLTKPASLEASVKKPTINAALFTEKVCSKFLKYFIKKVAGECQKSNCKFQMNIKVQMTKILKIRH